MAEGKEKEEGFEEWCKDNLTDESQNGDAQPLVSGEIAETVNPQDFEENPDLGSEDPDTFVENISDIQPEPAQAEPTYTVEEIANMIAAGDHDKVMTSVQCFVKANDESITYCGMMHDKCFIMRKPKGEGETRVVVSDVVQRIIGVCLDYDNTVHEDTFDTVTIGIVNDTLCITRYDYDYNVVKSTGITPINFFNNVTMVNKIGNKFVIGCSMVDAESGRDVQALVLVSEDFDTSNITLLKHELPPKFEQTGVKTEVRSAFLAGEDLIVFGFVANDQQQFFITLSQLDSDMQPGRFANINVGDQFKTVGSYAWYNDQQELINIVGFYIDSENGKSISFNASFDRQLQHIVQQETVPESIQVVEPETSGLPN